MIKKDLVTLALGAGLAGLAGRADAVVHGFSVFEYATNIVNTSTTLQLPFLQGTFGTDTVSGGSYRFRVGSEASATNYLTPTGIIFYQDASNLITNGFHNGNTLNSTLSGLFDEGNGVFRVDLNLAVGSGYSAGTNRVFEVRFNATNNDATNVPIQINWLYTGVVNPSGTWSTSSGSKTWANTNSFYNPSPTSLVIVNPIPEPAVGGAMLLGAGALALAGRKKRKHGLHAREGNSYFGKKGW